MNKIRKQNLFAAFFSFVFATGIIIAITWPWVLHFNGEFIDHWDPPFHAWKLEFIARRIIAGDWFVKSTNTNMLYPFTGTLYYEALQWPPAVFAAAFFAFTPLSAELIYHITLVVFWALSAPCMYYLLRQLDCKIIPAFVGSIIFCILPHRISYMVEFQMEMIFAMPLFFAFVLRYLKNYRIVDGLLAAFFWWLFAVSELYQAIFAAMATPFILVSFLTKNPKILKEKKFWLSAGIAIIFGISLLFIMLTPYLQQHTEGAVFRSLTEIRQHSSQPFSFLIPFGRFYPWIFPAIDDEFSLYPTIALILLALGAAFHWFFNIYTKRRDCYFSYFSVLILFISTLGFFLIAALLLANLLPQRGRIFYPWTFTSLMMLISSILCMVFHTKDESNKVTFMKGLLVASVLFFFLSLGPLITLGHNHKQLICHDNLIYLICYKYILTFLSGFRVVSRFGILVLFFMIISGSMFFDYLIKIVSPQKQIRYGVILAFLVIITVSIEAIPGEQLEYKKIDNQRQFPAIKKLIEQHPICTLAICPSGPRRIEGPRMFSLLKDDWLYVYAWGGYFPQYSSYVSENINSHNPNVIHYELSKFFPEAILILDKATLTKVKKSQEKDLKKWFLPKKKILDYERIYAGIADILDADNRFTIFKLHPYPPKPEATKIFRSDIAKANPRLSCILTSSPNSTLEISFNKKSLSTVTTDKFGQCSFTTLLSESSLEKSSFNTFSVMADGTNLVSISNFSLLSSNGSYNDVTKPHSK